jgi:hypothetical protein
MHRCNIRDPCPALLAVVSPSNLLGQAAEGDMPNVLSSEDRTGSNMKSGRAKNYSSFSISPYLIPSHAAGGISSLLLFLQWRVIHLFCHQMSQIPFQVLLKMAIEQRHHPIHPYSAF